ncbi:glycosyltransferase family 2 protein [Novosphingobium sp. P6W]|uniref:glycosyltransferase family 2 protein n=1 Tax=Novosphingobium sp. P6W TaxID=1609758 RepID=UPI000B04AB8D|nr:glycosyltransferase family 2 protein [Novosphingobium sp. P6W]
MSEAFSIPGISRGPEGGSAFGESRNGDVLIVVPCLNEEAHLPALLRGLLGNAHGALVVVADGGSVDASREIVTLLSRKHANLVLLDNPQRIQSAAVNLAARRFGAGRNWLLRIDAHAHYPDGFLDSLRLSAGSMRASSVVVPMVTSGTACFQKAAAAAQNSVLGTGGAPHRHLGRGQWVDHGHHALFDLKLFMAVGGYDEGFSANEDSELDRRLIAADGRIWLEPQAAITYFPRRTMGALFRQYRKYGIGRARNLKRHPVPVKLRQMLPLAVVPSILMALIGLALAPLRIEALVFAFPMLCWMVAALVAGAILGCRARSFCDAGAGVAAVTMHAGWSLGFIEETLSRQQLPAPPQPLGFESVVPPEMRGVRRMSGEALIA